jgi:hypothetical protein
MAYRQNSSIEAQSRQQSIKAHPGQPRARARLATHSGGLSTTSRTQRHWNSRDFGGRTLEKRPNFPAVYLPDNSGTRQMPRLGQNQQERRDQEKQG